MSHSQIIKEKIDDLKTKELEFSITPMYLGSILQEILDYIDSLDSVVKGSGSDAIDSLNKVIDFLRDYSSSDRLKSIIEQLRNDFSDLAADLRYTNECLSRLAPASGHFDAVLSVAPGNVPEPALVGFPAGSVLWVEPWRQFIEVLNDGDWEHYDGGAEATPDRLYRCADRLYMGVADSGGKASLLCVSSPCSCNPEAALTEERVIELIGIHGGGAGLPADAALISQTEIDALFGSAPAPEEPDGPTDAVAITDVEIDALAVADVPDSCVHPDMPDDAISINEINALAGIL